MDLCPHPAASVRLSIHHHQTQTTQLHWCRWVSFTAPLTLCRRLTVSPASWNLRRRALTPLLALSDLVEPGPLVRGSWELLPRTRGRRLVTRTFYSLPCDFPEPFSFCFAERDLPVLLSAGLSELPSPVKLPLAEGFWWSLALVPLWEVLPFPADNLSLGSCCRKTLSKGNKKPWEQGLWTWARSSTWQVNLPDVTTLNLTQMPWAQLLYLRGGSWEIRGVFIDSL